MTKDSKLKNIQWKRRTQKKGSVGKIISIWMKGKKNEFIIDERDRFKSEEKNMSEAGTGLQLLGSTTEIQRSCSSGTIDDLRKESWGWKCVDWQLWHLESNQSYHWRHVPRWEVVGHSDLAIQHRSVASYQPIAMVSGYSLGYNLQTVSFFCWSGES